MVLSEIDRKLLQRCLNRKPHAWEDFVDRFLGLVVHVIRHTARSRSIRVDSVDEEDLAAEFFLAIVNDDFAVLRRFRGESSLATYLTVVARRVVVRELLKRKSTSSLTESAEQNEEAAVAAIEQPEERITNREEVERLIQELNSLEAKIVRLYHLEGKSYQEIASELGIPENSIGPTLSRARAKMKQALADSSA